MLSAAAGQILYPEHGDSLRWGLSRRYWKRIRCINMNGTCCSRCSSCLGGFTKSAQFPFHFWLPGAMSAPTPASAYLHSATMVKAGIYLFARLSPVMHTNELWTSSLLTIGLVTMLVGAYFAVKQRDSKGAASLFHRQQARRHRRLDWIAESERAEGSLRRHHRPRVVQVRSLSGGRDHRPCDRDPHDQSTRRATRQDAGHVLGHRNIRAFDGGPALSAWFLGKGNVARRDAPLFGALDAVGNDGGLR